MGLGASVWSSNIETAEAGNVLVNTHLDLSPTLPFGGAKESGMGVEWIEGVLPDAGACCEVVDSLVARNKERVIWHVTFLREVND
jgi:hypothetical protein